MSAGDPAAVGTGDALRILLVGAGVRGKTWARVVGGAPGARLVGVVDQELDRARGAAAVAGEAGAEGARATSPLTGDPMTTTDLPSALADARPDAVIVATPPASHHTIVSEALGAGCHVLCEKPVSEDIDEVVDLVQQADGLGLRFLVGMNFRYLSTSRRIRTYAQSGELGALSYGQFFYVRHRDGRRADLNDYTMHMPHPMLMEQSIHHFDLIRYCYGSEVIALIADSWKPSWSCYDDDCCVSVLFRMENGVRANYMGTWTAAWNKMSFGWRSEFESGALIQREQFDDLVRVDFRPELGLSGSRFKTDEEAEPAVREELEPCTPFVDDSRGLLEELIRAIRGGVEAVTTGRDHLKTLGTVLACVESLETGRWVDLGELYRKLGIPASLLEPVPPARQRAP